jgi:hypothetical protein
VRDTEKIYPLLKGLASARKEVMSGGMISDRERESGRLGRHRYQCLPSMVKPASPLPFQANADFFSSFLSGQNGQGRGRLEA